MFDDRVSEEQDEGVVRGEGRAAGSQDDARSLDGRSEGDARKKRGGGPKTPEGKAVVRLNPIKHGVLSQAPVIPLVEREEDWLRLRDGVREYFDVQGALEEALADKIASTIWRHSRAVRFEAEAITSYLGDVPRDWRTAKALSGEEVTDGVTAEAVAEMDRMLMARLLPGDETLEKVIRYETRLHRFLVQSIHQMLIMKRLMNPGVRFGGVPDPELPRTGRAQTGQPHLLRAAEIEGRRSEEEYGADKAGKR